MSEKKNTYDLDGWSPAPGFVLCRPVKREELQKTDSKLMLPDKVGKVSDSVGVGEVILKGPQLPKDPSIKPDIHSTVAEAKARPNVGDLIAWMPFVDTIIEIKLQKYSLVPYDKIRAVRKAK